eukprot:GSA25T00000780001.1
MKPPPTGLRLWEAFARHPKGSTCFVDEATTEKLQKAIEVERATQRAEQHELDTPNIAKSKISIDDI